MHFSSPPRRQGRTCSIGLRSCCWWRGVADRRGSRTMTPPARRCYSRGLAGIPAQRDVASWLGRPIDRDVRGCPRRANDCTYVTAEAQRLSILDALAAFQRSTNAAWLASSSMSSYLRSARRPGMKRSADGTFRGQAHTVPSPKTVVSVSRGGGGVRTGHACGNTGTARCRAHCRRAQSRCRLRWL